MNKDYKAKLLEKALSKFKNVLYWNSEKNSFSKKERSKEQKDKHYPIYSAPSKGKMPKPGRVNTIKQFVVFPVATAPLR